MAPESKLDRVASYRDIESLKELLLERFVAHDKIHELMDISRLDSKSEMDRRLADMNNMNMRWFRRVAGIDEILSLLRELKQQGVTIMADLTALTAQVKANTDVEASAIVLLNGLSAQIASLKNDPVALQALADQLKTSGADLAAAITNDTPAA